MKLDMNKLTPHPDGRWWYIEDEEYAEEIMAYILIAVKGVCTDFRRGAYRAIDDSEDESYMYQNLNHANTNNRVSVWQIHKDNTEDFLEWAPFVG